MRVVSGAANAVLMVTLVKPIARLMVSRWRKRVQESAAATIGIPVQELLETALIEELAPPVAEVELPSDEVIEELTGRSTIRTLIIVGAMAAATVGIAVATAALIRRRREAQEAQAKDSEWVAIPVDAEAEVEEAEELEPMEALAD